VVFGVARVVRLNLLGYFLVLAIPTLLAGCTELLAQPNGFYHTQGMVCAAVLGALLAWLLAMWLPAKDASEESPAALQKAQ
jgi:hypothetical protein